MSADGHCCCAKSYLLGAYLELSKSRIERYGLLEAVVSASYGHTEF